LTGPARIGITTPLTIGHLDVDVTALATRLDHTAGTLKRFDGIGWSHITKPWHLSFSLSFLTYDDYTRPYQVQLHHPASYNVHDAIGALPNSARKDTDEAHSTRSYRQ